MTTDLASYTPKLASSYSPISFTITTGIKLTGIDKLAQRFTICLLTNYRTMKCSSYSGCSFIPELKYSNTIYTQINIAAVRALKTVCDFLPTEESSSDPNSERFGYANINNITYYGDSAVVTFYVKSRAGNGTNVNIDINL